MEAKQHFFTIITRGEKLSIDLPEGVEQAEIEVTVRPLHPRNEDVQKLAPLEIARKYKGTMKSSGYQVDEYDVYDQ